ncbi:MAG: hypothetical protein ACI3XJ_06450 [Oscillospiraceae bacterium]
MKKAILALLLALVLTLTGCASMLERHSISIAPYEPVASSGSGPSSLRVENYQGLVNAVLYLVTEGEEHGVLNLYNYTAQDVEADLTRACLEVVQEDPLGAYAVDYIKHDYSLIVSYYEANIDITYRRTPEQVASIVSVTGSSAIRRELRKTLTSFSSEAVLRVSYFAEDEDYILDLVRQAYYDAPAAALGMPEVTISLYPATGHQRIVEINLTYPESPETLLRRSQELKELAPELVGESPTAESLYDTMRAGLTVEEGTGHSSAYDALVEGVADSEGAALAYQLLCDQAKVECVVVRGKLDGAPHFWNIVTEDGQEYRHVDLSAGLFAVTDAELTEQGTYEWDSAEYPACVSPIVKEEKAENLN